MSKSGFPQEGASAAEADSVSLDSGSSRDLPATEGAVDSQQGALGSGPAPEVPVRRRAAGRRLPPSPAAPQRSPPGHSSLLHYRSVADIAQNDQAKNKVTCWDEAGDIEGDPSKGEGEQDPKQGEASV